MPKWRLGRGDQAWSTRLAEHYDLSVAALRDLALEDRFGQPTPPFEAVSSSFDSTTLNWLDERSGAGAKDELAVAPTLDDRFGIKELVETLNQSLAQRWPQWKVRGWAWGWSFFVHPDWLSYSPNHLNGGQQKGWQIAVVLDGSEPDSANRAANPMYTQLTLPKQRETFKVEQQELHAAGIRLEAITPAQQVMVSAQHIRSSDTFPKKVENPGWRSAYSGSIHFVQLPVQENRCTTARRRI